MAGTLRSAIFFSEGRLSIQEPDQDRGGDSQTPGIGLTVRAHQLVDGLPRRRGADGQVSVWPRPRPIDMEIPPFQSSEPRVSERPF